MFKAFQRTAASGLALLSFQMATPEAYAQSYSVRREPESCREADRIQHRLDNLRGGDRGRGQIVEGSIDLLFGDERSARRRASRGAGDIAEDHFERERLQGALAREQRQCREEVLEQERGFCIERSRERATVTTRRGVRQDDAEGRQQFDRQCERIMRGSSDSTGVLTPPPAPRY